MFTVMRNRVVYSPESSRVIGNAAAQQRLAYNAAVDHTLAHPNLSKFNLQKQLTEWRAQDPDRWHGNLRVQRPGLAQGQLAVRAFDSASLRTLRECENEQKLRQNPKPEKARRPKHPVRPGRSLDTHRLHRSRKSPTVLCIDDRMAITQASTRCITAAGITINLAKPMEPDADIRALTIAERRSSRRKGRNRPLQDRSYEVHIVVAVPDPEDEFALANPTGVDVGVANTISTADGRHYHQPENPDIAGTLDTIKDSQKRLKYGGRRWTRLQKQKRRLLLKHRNRTGDWEHHIAREIAKDHSLVAVEKLTLAGMKRSARGTPENPGSNIRQKAGLNRSLSRSRPGEIHRKIERHCEKNGTAFTKVPPRGTSQTCPLCGWRAKENRKSQAEFLCQRCHLRAHADSVAALNVRTLGVAQALTWLVVWAHGPDENAATIRRRQGLPPLSDTLILISGRPGRPLGPSKDGNRQDPGLVGRAKPLEPKLSI